VQAFHEQKLVGQFLQLGFPARVLACFGQFLFHHHGHERLDLVYRRKRGPRRPEGKPPADDNQQGRRADQGGRRRMPQNQRFRGDRNGCFFANPNHDVLPGTVDSQTATRVTGETLSIGAEFTRLTVRRQGRFQFCCLSLGQLPRIGKEDSPLYIISLHL